MTAPVRRGFTLLEVLVAIAILGLGMTTILSAQTGLFATSLYGEKVSAATGLVRCKMSEVELKLGKEGYPLIDQKDEGACCNDEVSAGFRCKWKVEKVELPPPPLSSDLSTKMSGLMQSLGSLGAMASVGQTNGSVLGSSPDLGDVSKLLAGQTALPAGTGLGAIAAGAGSPSPAASDSFGSSSFGSSGFGQGVPGSTDNLNGMNVPGLGAGASGSPAGMGAAGLAPLVMTLVYPSLKPMLEASIRKVTVTISWQQGAKERELEIVQFVTNPMQGGLDPNAAQGLDAITGLIQNLTGGSGTAAGAGTGTGTGTGAVK